MLIIILRIIALSIFTLFCCLLVLMFYFILPERYWVHFVKFWTNGLLLLMGIKVTFEGNPTNYMEKNAMVVANHISWIDIPILYTQHPVGFISRKEIKNWPILGLLIRSGNTIFIDRKRKRDLIGTIQIVREKLQSGSTVGLFPEGKTSLGLEVMPFKSALFEAAMLANSTIIPFVIEYYTKDGQPTNVVTYADEINFWQCLISSLKLNGILVKVIPLPRVMACEFANRKELSKYLHRQIHDQFQTCWYFEPTVSHLAFCHATIS
ncbi:MAG TPA: lysophospholipid acyltransferase family protein [Aquella sp.]|nr:lysophospholipid acyltransferase family protein [Aquella sp.]